MFNIAPAIYLFGHVDVILYIYIYHLFFNIANMKMAHRNRWFTMVYLLKMVIFHGYVK